MGRWSFGRKVVGQFSRSRIVKFGITDSSDAMTIVAIDPPRSHCLTRPSPPVRQDAPSSPNDDPPRTNLGYFFPKPRCARLRGGPLSAAGGTNKAPKAILIVHEYRGGNQRPAFSLRRPTVRLLRSKHRLAARQTLCTPAKLTVEKLLDTRCAHRTWRTHGSIYVVATNGYRL